MPAGRPAGLQWEWTTVTLFVVCTLLAMWRWGVLAGFVVNLSVAAMTISMIYVVFKKHLKFGAFTPWVLLGIGILAFWIGSYTPLPNAINGAVNPLINMPGSSQQFDFIPTNAVAYVAGVEQVSWVYPAILVLVLVVLVLEFQKGAALWEGF